MSNKNLSRRRFVQRAAAGAGAGVVAGAAVANASVDSDEAGQPNRPAGGRRVWVASLCQHKIESKTPADNVRKMLRRMEETLPMRPDIICLPECFHVANLSGPRPPLNESTERPIGEFSSPFAEFAKQHRCNVVCSIHTREAGRYYNAAVVIDREGRYVGEYRKINPTEGELSAGMTPGPLDPPVFDLDFGKIGIQICYDVNWHANWTRLRDKGAEMIFWPSAFTGGAMLSGLAWINKVPIVSSTRIQPTAIYDPLGDEVVSTGRFGEWVCAPINLDFAVLQGWQMINKLDAVRQRLGRDVNVRIKHDEAWALLESLSPDVRVPDVLKEFEMETSTEMLARNTKLQDARRPRKGTS